MVALASAPAAAPRPDASQEGAVLIHAARLIDGRGQTTTDTTIEVRGSKIVSIGRRAGPYTHDLGDVTLLPGLIDVHVHLNWYFGPSGKYGDRGPAGYQDQAVADNARATLMAGFTTVQSLGWAGDKQLKERIATGEVVGPRIISSLGQIQPRQAAPAGTGRNGQPTPARAAETPDELRARVRQLKADGAEAIKLFASGSIRDGGKMNVTPEQIEAVCGEAKAQGLRSLVHAHDPQSIITSVKAGCFEIEHGAYADDAAIKAMKDANVFFDPNIGLVLQNYVENKDKYMGSGNFNEEGFAFMEKAVPTLPPVFAKAMKAGVRMPMGTDAVAGAHGQNAREIFVRVKDGGQKPMDGIIGATSLAAESLGLDGTVGTLKAGYEADIIAVKGDPLKDITALKNVTFVMRAGTVFKK